MAIKKKTKNPAHVRTDARRGVEQKSKARLRADRRAAGQHEINGAWVSGETRARLEAIKTQQGLASLGAVIDWLATKVDTAT